RETPEEAAERMRMIRDGAEGENERFFRDLAIERRSAFLEGAGYEGHAAEDLADENFLRDDDVPPFEITPSGEVFCSRDGKPVTTYHQTLAEVWYWQHVEWGNPGGLVHDEEEQAFFTPKGELALSRDYVSVGHLFRNP
ncbi:MAG: hypothetical protein M3R38_03830, partial [Actinomycetota bacterium]|nr:hypothetical protein [Actinomycetota bacterium]